LGGNPEKGKDEKGRPKLLLTLEKTQIKPLEEFTTKNVNKSIAIVIGKDVVTTHKIRQPITGGRMQITRCTDNGCEAIYTQLQGKTATRN
jgi:preprotein translocase subunit SecD